MKTPRHTLATRRDFLKQAAVAAGGALLLPRAVLARASSRNSLVNVGVIGLGRMASSHIRSFVNDERCRITAVCDVDDERIAYEKKNIASKYEQAYGEKISVAGYKDFRALLANPTIDAVVIATPDHWHAIMSILAARAGKAIYCEKPMTFTIEEGQRVVDAVRASGVVFQTGSQQRSDSGFRRAVQLARTGMLGDIKEVWCDFGRWYPTDYNWPAEPLPAGMDWEMWVGPAVMRPYTSHFLPPLMGGTPPKPYGYPWGEWRWHIEYGNGLQADWGAHHFDIALWGLGLDGKGPKYVEVFPSPNPKMPADTKHISYTFANGTKVRYGCPDEVKRNSGKATMVTFVGTEATASCARGGRFWVNKPSLRNVRFGDGNNPVQVSNDHRRDFIDAVLTGRPTICPPEVGQSSCNMCLIGNIAHQLGRSLEWDWRTRSFVGDEVANRFLWRENRGEWAKI
ncbi:putative dehydrogenase [Ereboglobus sp. PH5-5]|uniref:Gfo/Idh/MocA family protein n=1 Tax=unclassified Ereboglobus TaxID=2626932 RepID=UPI002405B04E|nr:MULTISPECIES: Gfo/Idh/MocA family oxidoreductase [unclassified Ereboglobus]MDF9827283.1 putative dehydrogenase [Ereboglobus sp. PH5-10]MDF9833760.1 putative dehydrogenase [Ereboglobus sp. PH5-5]